MASITWSMLVYKVDIYVCFLSIILFVCFLCRKESFTSYEFNMLVLKILLGKLVFNIITSHRKLLYANLLNLYIWLLITGGHLVLKPTVEYYRHILASI